MANLSHYFAIGESDLAWGLHILDCGSSMVYRGTEFPGSGHPRQYMLDWHRGRVLHEYQLFYLYKGRGLFHSRESGSIELEEGTVVLVHPDIWHRYQPAQGSDWYTYWVGFDGDIGRRLVANMPMTVVQPAIRIGYHEKLVAIFMKVLEIGQDGFTGYQQVLAGELMRLFGWLRTIHRQNEIRSPDGSVIVQGARTIMMREKLNVPVEAIAAELNVGYSRFRKLFKASTGMAPGQYMLQMRMKQAERLLTAGDMPVKRVADELGFDSPQYFSRIFRRKYGLSPVQYRKKCTGIDGEV